jgi:DNA repair protein RadC
MSFVERIRRITMTLHGSKEHFPVQKCIAGNDITSLSDIELLAVIIGTGMNKLNALDLATQVYSIFRGTAGIHRCGIRELATVKGIGLTKAVKILAALELGKRIIGGDGESTTIDSPSKVWKLFLPEITGLKQEIFRTVVLNNKNLLLKKSIISVGTISETIVHPREIFRDAIRESGASIIIAHNHPSGVLTPSKEDLEVTKRIAEAGKILGIHLIDHVILSERSYLSLREENHIDF